VDPLDITAQIFIIRRWYERIGVEDKTSQIRGVVEYLKNGERRYFLELKDIEVLISGFLESDA
jgi:hypothetical protein